MLKFIFCFMVAVHGLIHLLGFLKEWKLMEVEQLSGKTLFRLEGTAAKIAGILWLAAAAGFLASAAGYFFRQDWWMTAAVTSLVLSQALIVLYWKDARAGTIANIIILPVLVVSFADASFDRAAHSEARAILAKSPGTAAALTEDSLKQLPPPVKRWLLASGAVGREGTRSVRLKQAGQMKTKPDGSWMPFEAEQYFSVEEPAFLWNARVHAAPVLFISGKDRYAEGKGSMLIRLLSLFTIADAKGPELDQGAMVRYLAETAWFPSAALSSWIRWEAVDESSARAVMTWGGTTASGVFRFNERGEVTGFEAKRYREVDGKYSLGTWVIRMKGYRSFDGVRVPYESEVAWKQEDGDFTWLKLKIVALEYNRPGLY